MRGSEVGGGPSGPGVDARYGFPLHRTPSNAVPALPSFPPRDHAGEQPGQRRVAAPLFSPKETPELIPASNPPHFSDDDDDSEPPAERAHSAPSSAGTRVPRAPRDGYASERHSLPGEKGAQVGSGLATSPRSHSPRQSAGPAGLGSLSHALPRDVLTSMALALGAPERPARAGPAESSSRGTPFSEGLAAGPVAETYKYGDSFGRGDIQSYGRVCDLLFFGDELPIPLALVDVLPATGVPLARTEMHATDKIGKERILASIFSVFAANDQIYRLLRACTLHQIKQTKSRREVLRGEFASRHIIIAYVSMVAGDYLRQLIAPTIRALQGPWTANDAGLKGSLDRLLSRLATLKAPHEMRTALRTVCTCMARKYGSRAISTLAHMLVGELLRDTIHTLSEAQDANQVEDLQVLTPEGARFLDSIVKVLSKLALNESFSGGSKLYHINSWIQSHFESFQKSIIKIVSVEDPVISPWNSGCSVKGPPPVFHVLLRALTENKEEIHRFCTSIEWFSSVTLSHYQSRLPILWDSLERGRRRGNLGESLSSPPRSARRGTPDLPEKRMHPDSKDCAPDRFLAQMVSMVTQQSLNSERKSVKSEGASSRMQQLSATVTDMDLDSRDLVSVPELHHFKNLQVLNIPRNRLQELVNLPVSLRTLDCSYNQLSQLKGVECLFHLETLNASHNLLQEVAQGLVNSRHITSLDLSHNQLHSVVEFSHMPGLQQLLLDHNRFSTLQDLRLVALNPNLATITMNDNPLCQFEPGYYKEAASMLPQVDTINEVGVVKAQIFNAESLSHRPERSPVVGSSTRSPVSPTRKPTASPFIKPASARGSPFLRPGSFATPGKIMDTERDANSPSLKPGVMGNATRIPDIERVLGSPRHSPRQNPSAGRESPTPMTPRGLSRKDRQEDDATSAARDYEVPPTLRDSVDCLSTDQSDHTNRHLKSSSKHALSLSLLSADIQPPRQQTDSPIITKQESIDDDVKELWPERGIGTDRDLHGVAMIHGSGEACNLQSSVNARKHSDVYSISNGVEQELHGGKRGLSTIQMLAQAAIEELRSSLAVDVPARPAHMTLKGTGRLGTAVQPSRKTSPTSKTLPRAPLHDTGEADQRNADVTFDLSSHRRSLSSDEPGVQRSVGHGNVVSGHATEKTRARSSEILGHRKRDVHHENKHKHTTRIAAAKVSPRNATSTSPIRSSVDNSRHSSIISVSPNSRSMSPPTSSKHTTARIRLPGARKTTGYRPVDMAEMIMQVETALKIMTLVFRGWKLSIFYSRVKTKLGRPACPLVLIPASRYRILVLRPILLSWADLLYSRMWIGLKRYRRLQTKARAVLSDWRSSARKSMLMRDVVYRMQGRQDCTVKILHFAAWMEWQQKANCLMVVQRRICRMLLNRITCVAFESFVQLRERSLQVRSAVLTMSKRLKSNFLRAIVRAWEKPPKRKQRLKDNVVGKVFSRVLGSIRMRVFRAWRHRSKCKVKQRKASELLGKRINRRAAQAAFEQIARNRDLRRIYSTTISRLLCSSQRLHSVASLRAWLQIVHCKQARIHSEFLCRRRLQKSLRSRCLRCWISIRDKGNRKSSMEDNFGTLVQEAKDRTVYRVFHAWLRLHLAACEHSVIIVRTLRKRRRRYMHTALARLRAKSLLGRRLHAFEEIFVRKALLQFAHIFVAAWQHHVRRKRVLLRRFSIIAVRHSQKKLGLLFSTWHDVTQRRFHVAAMLDKILLKRKLQHSEVHVQTNTRLPRMSPSPRHSPRGNSGQSPRQLRQSPRP